MIPAVAKAAAGLFLGVAPPVGVDPAGWAHAGLAMESAAVVGAVRRSDR